jgi:hypothetical protein
MSFNVSRTLPTPRVQDGNAITQERYNGYQEKFVSPVIEKMYPLADEGSYYTALNPTPGTGVAGAAAPTTFDNTKPYILMRNQAPTGSGLRIKLDYIKLVVTAAGTGGTTNYATHQLDAGAGYTSGGSTLTPNSPNVDLVNASQALIYAGAVVATAGASPRTVAHQLVRPVIPVVGDTLYFVFGSQAPGFVGLPIEGTLICERAIPCPPVVLGPGEWYKLVLWRASQSAAASYEVEMAWWER